MQAQCSLEAYLSGWGGASAARAAAAGALLAIAQAGTELSKRIAQGPSADEVGTDSRNSTGDVQTPLDVWANDLLVRALTEAGVGAIASEELDEPVWHNPDAEIAVAMDPLDGSSNVNVNVSIGTIFSILPMAGAATFLQPGRKQIAAGYLIYGPQCELVLTVGKGTIVFRLDPSTGRFFKCRPLVTIPPTCAEFAINMSNYRHWSEAVRLYIDDCLAGSDGPRGSDVNMRWLAAVVVECHRILSRGGVYLYPRDKRKKYQNGRLRLVYEASPLALLVEQAGGSAIDGAGPILDIVPSDIHQVVPLIFGSREEVERVARYKVDPNAISGRAPLFSPRGLLRA